MQYMYLYTDVLCHNDYSTYACFLLVLSGVE